MICLGGWQWPVWEGGSDLSIVSGRLEAGSDLYGRVEAGGGALLAGDAVRVPCWECQCWRAGRLPREFALRD